MRKWVISTVFLALAALAGGAQAQYYGDQYRDDRYGDQYHDERYGYRDDNVIRCESIDGRYRECNVGARGGVRLVRQISKAVCVEGQSWGSTRGGVWVNHGCRGDFAVGYGNGGGYGGGGYGDIVRCDSNDNRWNHCPANTRRGVELIRQLSRSPCIRGQSWGWDQRGIWVSGGCRAEFQLRGRGGWGGGSQGEIVRCDSNDGRPRHCPTNTRGGVRLIRQLSRAACIQGQSWGYDRNGIWVERGCRAEFEVGYRGNRGWGRDDD